MRAERAVLISGIGGQGIVFAGRLLARAWFALEKHVALRYSYGAEVMGTAVHSEVLLSPRPILFPYLERADVAVVLHGSAWAEVLSRVKPAAFFVADEGLKRLPLPTGVRAVYKPFVAATTKGRPGDPGRASPVVALGYLAREGVVDWNALRAAVEGEPAAKENEAALRAGYLL